MQERGGLTFMVWGFFLFLFEISGNFSVQNNNGALFIATDRTPSAAFVPSVVPTFCNSVFPDIY